MSPSSTIPSAPASAAAPGGRTLLLAPPSLAAHEDELRALFAAFDRATSDLQMLDRLAAGVVALPPTAYGAVLLLTRDDGARRPEAAALLTRPVLARVAAAMRPGARLAAQDGAAAVDAREALLAGLAPGSAPGEYIRSDEEEEAAVPLRFGAKKNKTDGGVAAKNGNGSAAPVVAKPAAPVVRATPAGVGFVDLDDDLDDLGEYESGDELVPEDELLTEEERNRPVPKAPECPPGRRRACKDCTCGLAQRLEKEDREKRAALDQNLAELKVDLAEMDFTVPGKTGSCGSCSLGDAFRCADCPYLGLPPFKDGQPVLLDNVTQL